VNRARQAALLARPVARTLPWLALVAAAALAFAVVRLGDAQTLQVRLAALALCVGAAFLLDDPAAETIQSVPTPLLVRRLLRLALAAPALAASWVLVLQPAVHAPAWELTLELGALLALAVAVAALIARGPGPALGGVAGGPAVLVLFGLAALLPHRWALLVPGPEDPRWTTAHARWAFVLAAGLGALVWASLDPVRRRRLPRPGRGQELLSPVDAKLSPVDAKRLPQ